MLKEREREGEVFFIYPFHSIKSAIVEGRNVAEGEGEGGGGGREGEGQLDPALGLGQARDEAAGVADRLSRGD